MYVYIESEPGLWTVGFYSPDFEWMPESDHKNKDDAALRVAWLNGGAVIEKLKEIDLSQKQTIRTLIDIQERLKGLPG